MNRKDAETSKRMIETSGPFLPPSRATLFDLCLDAMDRGPVLVSGDAGIGKTWLVDMVARRASGRSVTSWISVDLTPADGPAEFYRHLAAKLGLPQSTHTSKFDRIDVADALLDRRSGDEMVGLILDESQNYATSIWEEVRVLANRIGEPDGFAWMFIVGQTSVVRKFATRPFAALESRLSAHAHLRPLTVDESVACVESQFPDLDWSTVDPETLHRDACGNPARLLRKASFLAAGRFGPNLHARRASNPPIAEAPVADRPANGSDKMPSAASTAGGLMGPDRPPLHVEDNAIEVGWSADALITHEGVGEALVDPQDGTSGIIPASRDEGEQTVNDHYAALQAWREWAENQSRRSAYLGASATSGQPDVDRMAADAIDDAEDDDIDSFKLLDPDRPVVRAEGHQKFAPFGQLFPRMPQVRHVE